MAFGWEGKRVRLVPLNREKHFDKQLWNRGYATDAMRVRSHYAFHNLGLRMLLSEAMAYNTGSVRALEKTGYVEYGRLSGRYWKRGEYRDVIYFVLTRERWEQLQESDS